MKLWPLLWKPRLKRILATLPDDKAARAIAGMTICDVQKEVSTQEALIAEHCSAAERGEYIDVILYYLRIQVKTLALAYTKVESDMNALKMQRSNNNNFTQSMGDAFVFQAFLRDNFRGDVLANPTLKTLQVAQIVMGRLLAETGRQPDLSAVERGTEGVIEQIRSGNA
jgi:hypothetical protein